MPIEMPEGLPFSVDTWSRSSSLKRHHFLTHAHKDHSIGITTYSSHPIYSTQITKSILLHQFPQLDSSLFVCIEVGETLSIEDSDGNFSVTVFDANHCPGAAMFLFEGSFGNILHTGDCRLTRECLQNLPEKYIGKKGRVPKCQLDYVFLDCTFGNSSLKIPSKYSAIQQVINCIGKHPDAPVVYILCDLLAQKELLVEVSKTFGTKVYVDKANNAECYKSLTLIAPDILSEDPSSRFQLFEGFNKFYERAEAKIREARAKGQLEPLFIRPSVQWYAFEDDSESLSEGKQTPTGAKKDSFGVWHVCYSSHSSRDELEWALEVIQPKRVGSTTPSCGAMQLNYVKKHCLNTRVTQDDPLWIMEITIEQESVSPRASTCADVISPEGFTPLKNLRPQTQKCKIHIQIPRVWEVNVNTFVGWDFIGVDVQRNQIQGRVPKAIYKKWANILVEGNTVTIENFKVIETKTPFYAPLPQNLYIEFIEGTTMTALNDNTPFPDQHFHFVQFRDLQKRVKQTTYLSDVIGIIIKVDEIDLRKEMTLANDSNETVKITFWDAPALIPATLQDSVEPVIVVATSTIVTQQKGFIFLKPTLATKLYDNVDNPEAATLKQSVTKVSTAPKKRLTYIGDVRKISYIQYMVNKGSTVLYTCKATIAEVYHNQPWNYTSCCYCKRKVQSNENWCNKCNKQIHTKLRMRFQLKIEEDTGATDITAFEEVGTELLGKIVIELLTIEHEAGDGALIAEFDKIIADEYYFQVQMNDTTCSHQQKSLTAHFATPTEALSNKRQQISQ